MKNISLRHVLSCSMEIYELSEELPAFICMLQG
jgi:hypothetical protein